MKRSTYLGIKLHVKHKTFPVLGVFTRFLILGKIQDGSLFQAFRCGERCEVKKAMKSRGGLGREVRERL